MISLVVSPWVSPLAYIPCSFPLLCKSHGENGPNLFETHEELIRFILGPVPERLIAWLRISWGRLWLIFNPASLPSITGEHSSYFMPLFLVFILAESSHPSPPALPGRPAALPCLQSLPLPNSCAEIASPLSFLLGSSNLFFSRNSCGSAPVVQPERSCTNRNSVRSTGPGSARIFPPIEFSFCFTRQIICCDSYCSLSFAAWPGSMHHFVLRDA